MRILIVNPFGIGDVIFTLPLIRNLKKTFPHSHIGYLSNRRTYPILSVQPEIDSLYVYEKDEWRSLYKTSRIKTIIKFGSFLKSIKRMKFDIVFDLSLAGKFGFIFWILGIKKRLGYDYKNRGIFLNKKIKMSGYSNKHMVEYYSDLVALLGLKSEFKFTKLSLPTSVIDWGNDEVAELKNRSNLIISLIPGGGASWGSQAYKKRWEEEKYKELLNLMLREIDAGILLLGDKEDKSKWGKVPKHDMVLNYMGETSLLEFAALISVSDLVVTNDGGPVHIAAAFSIPTLSIFGPVSESVYGPYPKDNKHRIMSLKLNCRPCYKNFRMPSCSHHRCLDELSAGDVFKELKEHLSLIKHEK
ncbi:MAG: lipopolysaccharide heptosyltransferase II [Candidatus Saelkia tenebricola]|nr:lipopolysaccharide heptosyltransferase II [Candidatus Saelkia tenebricola]